MPDRQPNVLFVITHDASPRLGCYGDEHAVTPNLDALAARGERYDRHYCQWPLCGPSRTSLMSGLRPQHTKRHDNARPYWPSLRQRMPAGYATMGEAFKRAGYHSECVWQVLHAFETDDEAWSVPTWFPPYPDAPAWAEGKIAAEEFRYWQEPASFELMRQRLELAEANGVPADKLHRYARGPTNEASDAPDSAYMDGRATDHAVARLADLAGGDRPFFLAIGYEAGHLPWTAPKRDFDAHDPEKFDLPPVRQKPAGSAELTRMDDEPAQYYTTHDYDRPWQAGDAQLREMLHGHYASLTFLDRQVGRLLDALESNGLADDTIVVFTSDHGFHMGEHNYVGKHSFWDKSTHCPLIVADPSRPAAAVVEVTEHVDLLPTLCDRAGIDRPAAIDGRNLDDTDGVAFSYRRRLPGDGNCRYFDAISVRTATHRLTLYRDDAGHELAAELFDYATDPHESRNLAKTGDPVETDLRDRLAPQLADFPIPA